ncbi:MAG: rRNA maturation RNase YbeY [Actinomycetota bacterium]|nr:rRNA maturation RNase YbeY [Actinomycetota bacterium]
MTVAVEVENRSGVDVDEGEAASVARRVLAGEGIHGGDLGVHFVAPDEIRALKAAHLGVDEATDVLAFPIDAREPLPDGVPRQLGDVVVCPQAIADDWRGSLVHGLLHLIGHDHGDEMDERERAYR